MTKNTQNYEKMTKNWLKQQKMTDTLNTTKK